MISAVTCPTRTRTRFPSGTIDVIGPRRWFSAESVGASRLTVTSQGCTTTPTRPRVGSAAYTSVPESSTISVRPSGPGSARPGQQVAAGEAGHERMGGLVDELDRRGDLEQLAAVEDADAAGERGRVLEVVRDDDRRQRQLAQHLLQLDPHGRPRVGVERGQRLVEEQGLGVARERAREADALALPARQLSGADLREVRDPQALEQLADARLAAEGDVPLDAQVREERVVLEDEPDRPAVRRQVHPRARVEPDACRRSRSVLPQAGRGPRWRAAPSSCPSPTARRARASRARRRALRGDGRRGAGR